MLNPAKVTEVRRLLDEGGHSHRQIASLTPYFPDEFPIFGM